jgi:thioredoxin 1
MKMKLLCTAAVSMILSFQGNALAANHIYPEPTQAASDIQHALAEARLENKRVLMQFGGNWCSHCMVLNRYLHARENNPLLKKGYVLVHINIGVYDQNIDLASHYGIEFKEGQGVPALAVIDPTGQIIYSQNGTDRYKDIRERGARAVHDFLLRWQPVPVQR